MRRSSLRLIHLVIAAAALLPIASAAAVAQVRPDSMARDSAGQRVAPVVVTGKRTPVTVGGASALVVEVDSMRLSAAPVMEQALRELPFVLLRRNSRGETELSVRGSDSRQAAVLVDGVPITLGWDHRADPSLVPLTGARTLTVTRGLSSLLHGPNVLGGVVEVGVTQGADAARPQSSLSMASEVDQLGGHGLSIRGATPIDAAGRWMMRGGAAWRDRPGVALSDRVPSVGADPELRTNSDLRHLDGFASLRWRGDGGRYVGLTTSAFRAERGVPPELHVEEPRLWRYPDQRRVLATLSAGSGTVATPFGYGGLQASLGYNAGRTAIESFASNAYDQVVGTEDGDERTLTARLAGEHSLPGGLRLKAAATLAEVTYDEFLDDDPAARYRQRLWSVGSELLAPIGGGTQLVGGLVLDGADTPATGGKPALDALDRWGGRIGVTSVVGDGIRLHASLSQRARFPALRELYSGALDRFEPNPALRPERLVGGEAGATGMVGAVELQGVVFHHRLHDAVVRVATADRRFRRENRNEIRSSGVELIGGWRHGSGLSLSGDLMAQRVRLLDVMEGGGARHAEHQPELRAGLEVGAPLPLGMVGAAGMRYTGAQYCVHPDRGDEVRLGSEAWGDLSVARGWSLGRAATALFRNLVATLSVDNLTDAAVYDQCGMPQPGRTLRVMVEVR